MRRMDYSRAIQSRQRYIIHLRSMEWKIRFEGRQKRKCSYEHLICSYEHLKYETYSPP